MILFLRSILLILYNSTHHSLDQSDWYNLFDTTIYDWQGLVVIKIYKSIRISGIVSDISRIYDSCSHSYKTFALSPEWNGLLLIRIPHSVTTDKYGRFVTFRWEFFGVVNYDSIFFTAYACRIYLHLRVENSSLASVSTLWVEEKLDSARKQ